MTPELLVTALGCGLGLTLLITAHLQHRRLCARIARPHQPFPKLLAAMFPAILIAALTYEWLA